MLTAQIYFAITIQLLVDIIETIGIFRMEEFFSFKQRKLTRRKKNPKFNDSKTLTVNTHKPDNFNST